MAKHIPKNPRRSPTAVRAMINIYLEPPILEALTSWALEEGRSRQRQVQVIVENAVRDFLVEFQAITSLKQELPTKSRK